VSGLKIRQQRWEAGLQGFLSKRWGAGLSGFLSKRWGAGLSGFLSKRWGNTLTGASRLGKVKADNADNIKTKVPMDAYIFNNKKANCGRRKPPAFAD
jgi:hypothetical protein